MEERDEATIKNQDVLGYITSLLNVDQGNVFISITRTAVRSCRTHKRAFHFCSPGVPCRLTPARCGAADAAAAAAVYTNFVIKN